MGTLTLLRGPFIGSIDRLHHILVAVILIAIMIIHVIILTCPYSGCLRGIHVEGVERSRLELFAILPMQPRILSQLYLVHNWAPTPLLARKQASGMQEPKTVSLWPFTKEKEQLQICTYTFVNTNTSTTFESHQSHYDTTAAGLMGWRVSSITVVWLLVDQLFDQLYSQPQQYRSKNEDLSSEARLLSWSCCCYC